ncbi:MAG: hypothetical protein FWF85_04120 [Clostridiales bacterium]|nr:hypothetical protein [Clostridiales bacterium]MDR2713523.1 hypothetical protein [Clostridiales bacterium]
MSMFIVMSLLYAFFVWRDRGFLRDGFALPYLTFVSFAFLLTLVLAFNPQMPSLAELIIR